MTRKEAYEEKRFNSFQVKYDKITTKGEKNYEKDRFNSFQVKYD